MALHHFFTNKKINNDESKNIGYEIDLTVYCNVNKELTVQGRWSCYFKNKSTDVLKKEVGINTRFPQWAYIQVSFKPVFFNRK